MGNKILDILAQEIFTIKAKQLCGRLVAISNNIAVNQALVYLHQRYS